MRRLSLILLLLAPLFLWAQDSPHGKDFKYSCDDCHTTEGWKYSANAVFNHDKTNFRLEGQHTTVNCKQCHTSLVFSEAKTNCSACHADLHNTTVGNDCARCHTPKSWIVTNITEMHQRSRFPLLGAHNTADCSACHTSASNLEFQPLGITCYDCHKTNYESTTNPNHRQSGLSTDCVQCHRIDAFEWNSTGFNHDFFPLSAGHQINDCAACHKSNVFEPLSPECYSCHQTDFQSATNPKHNQPDFSTVCTQCHTTNPDWKPARFDIHDAGYFPIYSGSHKGEWESCTDCHKQPDNYSLFSCVDCHEHNKSKMDGEHDEVNGYSYNSIACYGCHPTGREEGAFNHNVTGFELKGAHIQTDCASCHKNGFSGTSPLCNSCHTEDFQQAINPNHTNAGISSECKDCHTENAWKPSLFDHIKSSGFALSGGHSGRQCSDCHIGNTTSATSPCYSCHQTNYNQAPNHLAQKFPTQCEQCHNSNSWSESMFNHSNTAFPLTGAHVATECVACHTAGYSGTPTLCNTCHTKNYNEAQNPSHIAAGISNTCETCHNTSTWIPSLFNHTNTTGFALTEGHSGRQCSDCHIGNTTSATSACYSCHQANYNQAPNHLAQKFPTTCEQCHNSNSWSETVFNHNNTAFPLTGAHVATECAACHTAGYTGTPTLCNACHTDDYNKTTNPVHSSIGISTSCNECHTTNPGWQPATFPIHQNFFVFKGAHQAVATNCFLCHTGNYNNTPNTCYGCHTSDYNGTTDPAHKTASFPTTCESCHTESAWTPSTFNHDGQYFPIYSGKHQGKWNNCIDCHTQPTNYAVFSCTNCHEHNKTDMDNDHREIGGYVYNSVNCLSCHPKGDS
jgi:hypothetical protein